MQFDKVLPLPVPPDDVWAAVTDLSVLAACLPGAQLAAITPEGRSTGSMSVRAGAMLAQFEGEAWVSARDDEARVVEVTAEGAGAHGRAQALIRGSVEADGAGSRLQLAVTVDIAGQLARLGQGMAQPVVDRLVERFGAALTDRLTGAGHVVVGPAAVTDTAASSTPLDNDVLDLGSLMPIPPAARRGLAAAAAVGVCVLLARLLRRSTPTVVIYACSDHERLAMAGERDG